MVGALVAALVAARVALAPRLEAAARLLVALRLACALHHALPVDGGGAAHNLADRDLRESVLTSLLVLTRTY